MLKTAGVKTDVKLEAKRVGNTNVFCVDLSNYPTRNAQEAALKVVARQVPCVKGQWFVGLILHCEVRTHGGDKRQRNDAISRAITKVLEAVTAAIAAIRPKPSFPLQPRRHHAQQQVPIGIRASRSRRGAIVLNTG